jgi:putative FmdB family regulatory protein
MPVYEYRCKACGRTFDIEHGFHDERPTKCSACGGQLARVFHPPGVVFKGSGFHKTDYSRSGLRKEAGSTGKPEAAKTDGATPSKSENKPSPSGDAKGASDKPKASDSGKKS